QLDEVILFDRRRFGRSWRSPRSFFKLSRFAVNLRKAEFDLVLDLQGLLRSGLFAWRTRAPFRVGFKNARELAPMFYTHRVETGQVQHAVDRYLALAEAIGCGTSPVEFRFVTTDEDRAAVSAMLPSNEAYAVLLPGSNWRTKRWPVERFAGLIDPLRARFGFQ